MSKTYREIASGDDGRKNGKPEEVAGRSLVQGMDDALVHLDDRSPLAAAVPGAHHDDLGGQLKALIAKLARDIQSARARDESLRVARLENEAVGDERDDSAKLRAVVDLRGKLFRRAEMVERPLHLP